MTPTNRHPWFAPLYRRLAVTAAALAWLGLELYGGETFWIVFAAGVAAYAVWALLLTYRPPAP